ncbi:MAG TPA: TPM domain-containing protein [Casimicrobiaceae bacterium]|nr:TPM domain-containing protein [Casimicrobiaceae bacterium]
MSPTKNESDAIGAQIAAIEARCGVQIVTAVIGKADHYIELPWKAFALGASLAAVAAVAADALRPDWSSAYAALWHAMAILGAGAASALAAIFFPAYARLFLRPARRDAEVRHYAQSLFLRRELFKTQLRRGILVLVAMFERKVEILPDTGLHGWVKEAEWRTVIASMTPELAAGRAAAALQQGLARLDELLLAKGLHVAVGEANELPDRPIEERGAT